MAIEWNGETAALAAKEEAAKRLQRAVQWFWMQHVRRLSISNPLPYVTSSKPGEYPRKRTGNLIANVLWAPTDIVGIMTNFKVRVGVGQPGMYGLILEFWRDALASCGP